MGSASAEIGRLNWDGRQLYRSQHLFSMDRALRFLYFVGVCPIFIPVRSLKLVMLIPLGFGYDCLERYYLVADQGWDTYCV